MPSPTTGGRGRGAVQYEDAPEIAYTGPMPGSPGPTTPGGYDSSGINPSASVAAATQPTGTPRWNDYREAGAMAGADRGVFRRMRKAGAFDPDSPLRGQNPFTPEGAEYWAQNPTQRFSGPGRQKPTNVNIGGAIFDIIDLNKPAHEAAYNNMTGVTDMGQDVLAQSGAAITSALQNPAVSPEQLRHMQAVARQRVGWEAGRGQAGLAARFGEQGYRTDDLNAAYAALKGDTLYRLGEAEIDQGMKAGQMNRDALMQAIQSAAQYTGSISTAIDTLLKTEGFRESLSKDEINALLALRGLEVAKKK